MIILIIILFIFGLIAILLEAVVPFGISAILGVGAIAFSGYLAFDHFGFAQGVIYCVIAAGIAGILVRFAVKSGLSIMTLSPPGRAGKKGNRGAGGESTEAGVPKMGEMAKVVQPLRPTGTIEWEGQRLPARASLPEFEYPVGTLVRIEGKDSIFWTVVEGAAESPPAGPEAGTEGE